MVAVRLRPTRVDLPYCLHARKATAWPGQSEPTTLRACGPHREGVKALGVVMAETPLGEDVATRTVTPDAEEEVTG